MADQEIRILSKVDVQGLSEAVDKFHKFTGSAVDAQKALRQIGGTAQEVVRTGTVSPHQADVMLRNVDNLKRGETEITRIIGERKKSLEEILKLAQQHPSVRSLVEQGLPIEQAAQTVIRGQELIAGGSGIPKLQAEIARREAQLGKVRQALPQAEMLAEKIGTKVGQAQTTALNNWLPKFGRLLRTGLGLAGIGGAASILAQARGRAVQFYPEAADIEAFLGRDVKQTGLKAAGPYGLYAAESLRISGEIGAVTGRAVTTEMVREFAGMGLFMGLGRGGIRPNGPWNVGDWRFK